MATDTTAGLGWRLVFLAACVPPVGSLLAKSYGLLPMRTGVLAMGLPATAMLLAGWYWARRAGRDGLADALAIGAWGGLLGTFAYDVARFPFWMYGTRVYGTIGVFGVWLLEAETSSRFTEVTGWLYHFWNGITFGIMYALVARGRHWTWGVAWGCVLETIMLVSPLGTIFHMTGDFRFVGIAYVGHVFYGATLGRLVQRWGETRAALGAMPDSVRWALAAVACVLAAWPLLSVDNRRQDAAVVPSEFRVDGMALRPDWLRIQRGGEIRVHNPGAQAISVFDSLGGRFVKVPGGEKRALRFPATGIHQLYMKTDWRTRSSFVIVEPVEELR